MSTNRLIDKYNRHLNYLRVSITDRCNLRCIYCLPKDRIPKLSHDEILSYEEILRVIRIGVDMGITKVRITGGEPLVRKGVYDFLENLTAIQGLEDVSLTTNGMLLAENIDRIKDAGISRLNVSLDSLSAERYREITGRDGLAKVWKGIARAQDRGMEPIKINVVALRGYNDGELGDFAALTLEKPYHVRFIEYMPMGMNRVDSRHHLLTPEIKERIAARGELIPLKHNHNDGPAERFKFLGARGEIGFISALSHHFCKTCNRLRLTASGQLRSCLLGDHQVDIKTPLRTGCGDAVITESFLRAVQGKPSRHRLSTHIATTVDAQMSSIGG